MEELREGFTTGTCAAIATGAAARMIFLQEAVLKESVLTPSGKRIETEILYPEFSEREAGCAVRKDAGSDPDVTDGILIYSRVSLRDEPGIIIDGGEGIGRVTKPGLFASPGEAAINKVPRQMIREAAERVAEEYGFEGGISVLISAPEGRDIALKTFNPRLGIEGGISILGSSGIVRPMSHDAIIETIKLEISVRRAAGVKTLYIVPGNYGNEALKAKCGIEPEETVICSNFFGEALDEAFKAGFRDIIVAGHPGKLIKLAGGIMNTHSKNADCRMEIMAANAAFFTDDTGLLREIMECSFTENALKLLEKKGILRETMERIADRGIFYIKERVKEYGDINIGMIIFSFEYGIIADRRFV